MILDSSALLAVLQNEPGAGKVVTTNEPFSISAVNLSEVMTKLIQFGITEKDAIATLKELNLDIRSVDEDIALLAGSLTKITRKLGLSLGDRICLATAIAHSQTALTADRIWADIKHEGLDVIVIS